MAVATAARAGARTRGGQATGAILAPQRLPHLHHPALTKSRCSHAFGGVGGAAALALSAAAAGAASSSRRGVAVSCAAEALAAPPRPLQEHIQSLVAAHPAVVFSKRSCPFCARAKQLLEATGAAVHAVELDALPAAEGAAYQDELLAMTGARTVPRIFVGGQCLGGCDDISALHQAGKLQALVQAAQGAAAFAIEKSEAEWLRELGPKRYRILRQGGTEMPGSHEYDHFMPAEGHFACGACDFPLFSAKSKFRSSCGWPVFDSCYHSPEADGCHVGVKAQWGGQEIVCNRCRSHLGHVFFDAYSSHNLNGERH